MRGLMVVHANVTLRFHGSDLTEFSVAIAVKSLRCFPAIITRRCLLRRILSFDVKPGHCLETVCLR
jgi:hypothetical protein